MKRMKKNLRGRFWKRVIAYGLMCCLVMNTSVPTLLALEAGDVDGAIGVDLGLVTWGDHTVIPTDHEAIINWNNFNTLGGQSVTFNQPSALSAVLNRIDSGVIRTEFYGALDANGRVFIVNPAGVLFGGGSTVNVAQLVVSSLGMTDLAFSNAVAGGEMVFTGGKGKVENRGSLNADSIFLVGKKILNVGAVFAPNGLIVIAAGETAYIAQDGSSVVVEVSEGFYGEDTTPDIVNRSLIAADGMSGKIVLAAGDAFSRAISNFGGLTSRQGTIEAHAARVESEGRIRVAAAAPGGGGTIHLSGTEAVVLDLGTVPPPGGSVTTADAALHGPGGSITIECTNPEGTGTVTIGAGHLITARGGTLEGDGGTVKITADHFVIAGDIDASPHNPDNANGTLTIDPSAVTIESGPNAGAMDTLYEEDIEALSQGDGIGGATDLFVQADESITVQDIVDGIIKGGSGGIDFQATGDASSIVFEDTTDTLSTVEGDIFLSAGSGGITAGNLATGDENLAATPGQIGVKTINGGPISVQNLWIRGGQGNASVDVRASGDLVVDGVVSVGSLSPIDNVPDGADAQAMVYLESGDDMALNGGVTADAQATHAGDGVTKAHVRIFSGTNETTTGDLTVGDDLVATAQSNEGTSDALVEVDSYGVIEWIGDAQAVADGDSSAVHVEGRESLLDEDGGDRAEIIINSGGEILELKAFPDEAETHMSLPVGGNVLANDVDPEGRDIDVAGYTDPANGTLTLDAESGAFTYTPNTGFVGEDTFTYTATNGEDTTAPVTVTITIGNHLPTPQNDVANAQMNRAFVGNVLTNDTDPDGDPLTVVLDGTPPSNGTVVLNANGSFTYTPNTDFIGEDTFTYNATDGQLDGTDPVVVTATVTITVSEQVIPSLSPVAPGLERREIEYSGITALAKWVAKELGVAESNIQIWMANALASSRDIQPYETYARLRTSAVILKDISGAHIAALTQVVNEFATSTAPPTEEQMASIADAIASNAGADNQYGLAEEYLNALAQYISILNTEMGFSIDQAVEFAMVNYVNQLSERGNANVEAYIMARMAEL